MKRFLIILLGNIVSFIAAGFFICAILLSGVIGLSQISDSKFPWGLVAAVLIFTGATSIYQYFNEP